MADLERRPGGTLKTVSSARHDYEKSLALHQAVAGRLRDDPATPDRARQKAALVLSGSPEQVAALLTDVDSCRLVDRGPREARSEGVHVSKPVCQGRGDEGAVLCAPDRGRVGVSDNNRRARYYRITRRGRSHLAAETQALRRYGEVVIGILDATARA